MADEVHIERWVKFGYKPVGAIQTKLIARYLRTQRKNMRRFFMERGLFEFADRLNQIKKSQHGMLVKNRLFQKVLNDYAALANPTVTPSVPGSVLQPTPVIAGETEAENS